MNGQRTVDAGLGLGAAALVTASGGVWLATRGTPPTLAMLSAVPVVLALGVIAARRPVLAPAAVVVLLVIGDVQLPYGIPLVRMLALAAVVVVVTARLGGRGRPIGRSPLLMAATLLVLTALLSTFLSFHPALSLRQDVGHVVSLLLAAAVVMATADRSDLLVLAIALCVGGAVLSTTAFTSLSTNVQAATSDAALVVNRPVGVFTQPNQLGLVAAMTLCFSTALVIVLRRQNRAWLAVLCGAAALLALAALVVSLSRGAWIGSAVGLVVLAVLLREARTALLCVATVATLGVTLVATTPTQPDTPLVAQRVLSIFGGKGNPYDERPAVRAEALVQMSERPVVGSGPGAFPVAAYQGPPHVAAARRHYHPHNLLLTVGAEQGVVGMAALVGLIGTGAAVALGNRRVRVTPARGAPRPAPADLTTRGVSAASAAALAAVLGHGVVDNPLAHPVVGTMTWLCIGLLAACARSRSDPRPHPSGGGT
ncbi:O-antigen ligase family protein [Streptomyces sp. NPDC000070]|uniref:O-antigen ligase family protein n=1 Tax=Streptomyces sp. NPDC000070 TaxID=3154240 RepID=UPI003319D9B2